MSLLFFKKKENEKVVFAYFFQKVVISPSGIEPETSGVLLYINISTTNRRSTSELRQEFN